MVSFAGVTERSFDGKETDCSWLAEESFSVFRWKDCASNAVERFSCEVTCCALKSIACHIQVLEGGFCETWAGDCATQNGFCATSF